MTKASTRINAPLRGTHLPDDPTSPQRDKRHALLICLSLIIAIAAAYWPALHSEFVGIDDNVYVADNPHVQAGLHWQSVKWALQTDSCSNWHPLTWLSHMLDWQLYGTNAGGHHLTSVLLHVANTLLVFLLWRRMTGRIWPSAFIAALFGLHPLRVESVAWIAERKDVLSTLFGLLALWAYVRYAQQSRGGNQWSVTSSQGSLITGHRSLITDYWLLMTDHRSLFYLLSLLLFALSLMSKSMLVTLPFAFLLLDYWPLRRLRSAECGGRNETSGATQHATRNMGQSPIANRQLSILLEKVPFFALAAAGSALAYLVQKSGGAVEPLEKLSLLARLQNAPVAYGHYLLAFLWPEHLAVLYPHPGYWPLPRVVGAAGVLAACSLAAWFWRRKRPWFLVGWLWYLGMLVPVIGLVQVGVQAYADRYTYVPLIGIFVLVAWGIPEMVAGWKRRRLILAFGAAVVLLGSLAATSVQVRYWKDSATLFAHAIESTRDNAIAHNNLAFALARQGKWDQAVQHCLAALQINPDYAEAHKNLAFAYSQQKRWAEAIDQYTLGLKLRPDAHVHNNLGIIYANQGKWDQAAAEYAKAVALDPNHAEAHHNWGVALTQLGRPSEGIQQYEAALRATPDFLPAHSSLAVALLRQGKFDEARVHFLRVLQSKPDDLAARSNLGSTYLRQNRYSEAIEAYQQVLHYHPESYQAHFNLGVALSRKGQTRDAIGEFEAALRLKPDFSEAREQLRLLSAPGGSTAR